MAFTRRTHIVRIKNKNSDDYIDVEVLDAISFRIEGNKEVVLNMDAKKSQPLILDDTGGDHGRAAARPTMRTRMKRIKNPDNETQMLDIEVVEAASFRDQRGEEWVLDMTKPGSSFNISDGQGDAKATRRVHNEIVSAPFGKKKKDAGKDYITVVRADNIAFRRKRNEEVIISCPSSDDENAENVNFKRASTFVYSPTDNYDPSDDDSGEPTELSDSGDPHVYVAFVDKASGFMTNDEKIEMGPFWWIRKIHKPNPGLVWFFWDSKGGFDTDPIETVEAIVNLGEAFPGMPSFNMLEAPNLFANGQIDGHPTVANPYTDDMLNKYAVWNYQGPVDVAQTKPGQTGDVYIVDTANWQMVYNHIIQQRVTPVETRDQALADFARAFTTPTDPLFGQDPSTLSVTLEQVFINGFFQDVPNFPDPLAFEIFANAGWTFHVEPGSGGKPLFAEQQAGSFVLNVGLLQSLVPNEKEVTFTINVGSSKNAGGFLSTDARQVGKDPTTGHDFDRTFPTIDISDPLTSPDFEVDAEAPKPSPGGTITVTIRFGEPDPDTHVLGPPEVDIDSDMGGGGGGAG